MSPERGPSSSCSRVDTALKTRPPGCILQLPHQANEFLGQRPEPSPGIKPDLSTSFFRMAYIAQACWTRYLHIHCLPVFAFPVRQTYPVFCLRELAAQRALFYLPGSYFPKSERKITNFSFHCPLIVCPKLFMSVRNENVHKSSN